MPSMTKKMTLAQRYEYLRKQIKKNNGRDKKKIIVNSSKIHDDHGLDGSYYISVIEHFIENKMFKLFFGHFYVYINR